MAMLCGFNMFQEDCEQPLQNVLRGSKNSSNTILSNRQGCHDPDKQAPIATKAVQTLSKWKPE